MTLDENMAEIDAWLAEGDDHYAAQANNNSHYGGVGVGGSGSGTDHATDDATTSASDKTVVPQSTSASSTFGGKVKAASMTSSYHGNAHIADSGNGYGGN